MSTRKLAIVAASFALASSVAFAEGPNLGIPIANTDIEAWDISIQPDGTGLPKGSGTALLGAAISATCAPNENPASVSGAPGQRARP